MFKKIIRWWHHRHNYVIADVTDSSITISRNLFRHIKKSEENAKVFVFFIPKTQCYGFMLNPPLGEQPTQLADIQYNQKYKCIGFETLCPTVAWIFHKYNINVQKCKLSVTIHTNVDGRTYYQIEKPHK